MSRRKSCIHKGHKVCVVNPARVCFFCRGLCLPSGPARVFGLLRAGGNRPCVSDFLCAGDTPLGAVLVDPPFRHAPFFRRFPERKILFHAATAFMSADCFPLIISLYYIRNAVCFQVRKQSTIRQQREIQLFAGLLFSLHIVLRFLSCCKWIIFSFCRSFLRLGGSKGFMMNRRSVHHEDILPLVSEDVLFYSR